MTTQTLFIRRDDIAQGTSAWHEWRTTVIGSSDAPAIMGENPWKSASALLEEKIGTRVRFAGNAATRRGTELEPQARALYERRKRLSMSPTILQSHSRRWQAASVDGMDSHNTAVVEIKCGIKAYEHTNKTGKIPLYYQGQVQHILAVTGFSHIDYFCFVPGRKEILLKIERDDSYIDRLISAEEDFCRALIKRGAKLSGFNLGANSGPPDLAIEKKETPSEQYSGERLNGKFHGNGTYVWTNGDKYSGEWRDGRKHGQGRYEWSNGEKYAGEWTDNDWTGTGTHYLADGRVYTGQMIKGKRHGHGKMVYTDNGVYSGEWEEGLRSGRGFLKFPDGSEYIGEWKEDRFEGHGKLTWPKGSVYDGTYEGGFKEGLRHGVGTYIWPSGAKYVGDWNKGQLTGSGTHFLMDGEIYNGTFVKGHRHGHGTCTWPSGDEYSGEWVWGHRHGQGLISWSTGDEYSGEWVDGERTGKGFLYFKDGGEFSGDFIKGVMQGYGEMRYSDGSNYIGQWKRNLPDGQGTLIGKAGKKYTGIWCEGKLSGNNREWWLSQEVLSVRERPVCKGPGILYSDGSKYFGGLKNEKRHGVGVIIYSTDSWYSGDWRNNKRHGFGKYVVCAEKEGSKFEVGFYEGNWRDNRPNGAGVFEWSSGARYCGNWVLGVMNGTGSYISPDGSRYEGEWYDNCPHGEGILLYSNGEKYCGSFKFGWKESGTIVYADGQSYTGPWLGDARVYPTMGGGIEPRPLLEFEIEDVPSFVGSSFLRRLPIKE